MQDNSAPHFLVLSCTAKKILFITSSVNIMAAMIDDLTVNGKKMYQDATIGFSTATDLADWLVKNLKVSFRKAHQISGKIVRLAEKKKCSLAKLDLSSMQHVEPKITNAIYSALTVESSVKSKTSLGGTAPQKIKLSIRNAKKYLA